MRKQRFLPVILIGKSNLLREGLAGILRTAHFRTLASVSCADDLRQGKSTLQTPLFLIVHTGEDFDPVLEQIELCRSRHPNGRIAVVADHYRLNQLISAFRAGANGYFVNAITCDRFVKSIELVMLGETIFPPAFLTFIIDPSTNLGDSARIDQRNGEAERPILLSTEDPTAPLLSPREKVILVCIIAGDSNKCIARKMDIAEATVKVHVKAILRKIRVQNRTQAAIWGINNDPQMHLESASYSLRMADMSKAVANSVEAICDVQPLEPLAPPQGIDAAPLKRLSRK